MSATVQHLIDILEKIAPQDLAETWDNIGLLIGSPHETVTGILLGLDPTIALLQEAKSLGTNLVITHHPIIFKPLKALRTDNPTGRFIEQAAHDKINVIGCHTNLDAVNPGVSDVLAENLALEEISPLVPQGDNAYGLGRIGSYPTPRSCDEFIGMLKNTHTFPWLLAAGPRPADISRVAVCGGSCSELAEIAWARGADVFITAEVKHNIARWAEEAPFWIIDAGHFATENPAIPLLARELKNGLLADGFSVPVDVFPQESPLQLL